MAYDEFTATIVRKCSKLEQAMAEKNLALAQANRHKEELFQKLAEKDAEIARWKARSWDENVKFIAEAKENLLKEYIHLTELYGEQKHAIRKLTANHQQLMEKAVKFSECLNDDCKCTVSEVNTDPACAYVRAREFLNSPEVQAWKEQP